LLSPLFELAGLYGMVAWRGVATCVMGGGGSAHGDIGYCQQHVHSEHTYS
jgi:hypothetical protein